MIKVHNGLADLGCGIGEGIDGFLHVCPAVIPGVGELSDRMCHRFMPN